MGAIKLRTASALVLTGAVALTALASLADEIVIDHPGWARLPEAERNAAQAKLRANGVLAADDVVVYKAGPEAKITEKDVGFDRILKEICREKHLAELAKCATQQPPLQRTSCRQKENARYEGTKTKCE